MQVYDMVYLIGNAFMSFVIYKYLSVFYTKCRVVWGLEISAFIIYFLSITAIHVFIKIPLIVLASNLLLTFLCAQLYVGDIKKAVLSSLSICLSLTCIETLVAFSQKFIHISPLVPFEYESIFGIVLMRLLSYIFVRTLNGFKNIKNQHSLPAVYWVSLFAIPTISLCMLVSVFTANQKSNALVIVARLSRQKFQRNK